MTNPQNILVVQTAFPGDVVLTLPLIQALKHQLPSARIDVVVTPRGSAVVANHPAVRRAIVYDKKGADQGIGGFRRILREVRGGGYDAAIVPHRSLRSALLVRLAGIPSRTGFDRSAGRFFLTDVVVYDPTLHETDRNLSLIAGAGLDHPQRNVPTVYPSADDRAAVEAILRNFPGSGPIVAVAPGTVWETKQWPRERVAGLLRSLTAERYRVVLIGGEDDAELCSDLLRTDGSPLVHSAAGSLSILGSAELIRRCAVLVSNDSAPMHLAGAVGTPVVAIFGATVPSFGFGPLGPKDSVVETTGLPCRPCSIHGGRKCPIGTFVCMKNISVETVMERVGGIIGHEGRRT